MHDAALTPLGLYLGYLTEGHCRVVAPGACREDGHRRGNTQVFDVREGHIGIILHHDGHLVLPLPDLTYTQVVGGGTQGEGGSRTRDAQLR